MAKTYQCSIFIAISIAKRVMYQALIFKEKNSCKQNHKCVSNKSYCAQCRIIVEEIKDESSLCLSHERVNNVKLQWHLKQILCGIFIFFYLNQKQSCCFLIYKIFQRKSTNYLVSIQYKITVIEENFLKQMKQILKEGLRPTMDPLELAIMFLQGLGASKLLRIWDKLGPTRN